MQVSEIMSVNLSIALADQTLEQAARLMAEEDVGSLPVCDGRSLIGIITDRDIVVRGIAHGLGGGSLVREVMTDDPETVGEADDVEEVRKRMAAAQVRRLPVVDDDGELIGMVALADIALTASTGDAGETLEEISEPSLGEARTF